MISLSVVFRFRNAIQPKEDPWAVMDALYCIIRITSSRMENAIGR